MHEKRHRRWFQVNFDYSIVVHVRYRTPKICKCTCALVPPLLIRTQPSIEHCAQHEPHRAVPAVNSHRPTLYTGQCQRSIHRGSARNLPQALSSTSLAPDDAYFLLRKHANISRHNIAAWFRPAVVTKAMVCQQVCQRRLWCRQHTSGERVSYTPNTHFPDIV